MGQGRFNLSEVFRMLNHCAAGWSYRVSTHSVLILFDGKTFALRKGPGGGLSVARRVRIDDGEVQDMLVQFDISAECADKYLPGIWK